MAAQNARRTRPASLAAGLATVLGLAAAVAAVWLLLRPAPMPTHVRLGAGVAGGTWDELGGRLETVLETHLEGVDVEEVRTAGSVENVRRLQRGELDLAFVLADSLADPTLRLIAPLYDDVLHLVVAGDLDPPVTELRDLAGHAVAVGAEDSGTLEASRVVLQHAGVDGGARTQRPLDTLASFRAFEAGEVDAVFHFAALPGQPVRDLLALRGAVLVPLGECTPGSAIDGLCAAHLGFERAVIPRRTYGANPDEPVGTVSVKAVLACRAGLPSRFVRRVTEILFAGKVELARGHPELGRLTETFDASAIQFPLHAGADAYYHRKDPPFYVRYADPMSLAFTLLLAAASGVFTLRQWARRRDKNRIDRYYLEIETVAQRFQDASDHELRGMLDRLEDIRRRAFGDLVRERLRANESFRIFQASLRSEAEAIQRKLGGGGGDGDHARS